MKTIVFALALLAATSLAATPDTSLVLKPSAAQIKAARALDNPECPVTKEPVGSMGAGRTVIYQGKAVKLCCGGCVKAFAKNPAKFTAAAEASREDSSKPHAGHAHQEGG